MNSDCADAHCDLASSVHAIGDDADAFEEFQKAIDLRHGHGDALYNLGGLYWIWVGIEGQRPSFPWLSVAAADPEI